MKKIIISGMLLAILTAATTRAAMPPSKQGVMRVKEANPNPKPLDPASLQKALEVLTRNYLGPRSTSSEPPSPLLPWAKAGQSHQKMTTADKVVHTHLERGVIAVEPPPGQKILAAKRPSESPRELALRYLEENRGVYGIKTPRGELLLSRQTVDEAGCTHLHFYQHYQGIPVWGREMAAHLDGQGNLASTTGFLSSTPEGAGVKPSLPAWRALEIAKARLAADGRPMSLTEAETKRYGFNPPRPELWFWQPGPLDPPALAWVFELRPNARDWFRFFVSAVDGKVLDVYNATMAGTKTTGTGVNLKNQTVTLNLYQMGTTYYMIDASRPMVVAGQSDTDMQNDPKGVVFCLDLRGQELSQQSSIYHFTSANRNSWPDKAAVSALDYGGQIFNYYKNTRGRNSFDNQGKSMLMMLHVPEKTQQGQLHGMDNAFWNGSFVSLGDGYQSTTAWANAFDLVAHEFTHAHVQYTANLEYKFQSGALNETFADLGGLSLDNQDYLIGEDIAVRAYMPSGALRNCADPHNGVTPTSNVINDVMKGWQPAHMNEYVNLTQEQDNGGVHVNNGITNFVVYKILSNPAVGHAAGEKILFDALFNRLQKSSNFTDFRIAALASAAQFHGANSTQQNAVRKAFDDVGIVEGAGTQPPADTPPVAGKQYIVMVADLYDLYLQRDSSLYIVGPFTDPAQLPAPKQLTVTNTNVSTGRPLAIDPYGREIYFVDAQNKLRAIKPDGTGEMVVSNSPEWNSVAISPSGRSIALTRKAAENKIVILDTVASTITERTLTAPTTSQQNTGADVVKYADSLVFLDDQLLVYDCLNSVKSPSGSGTMEFWNVNVIDVTTGQIFALLPPQAAGIHVMNPIFASTNKSILSVEMYQEGASNKVFGINLTTGDVNQMFDNGQYNAFADYSVDDKYLLYNVFDAITEQYVVYGIGLGANKISTTGSPIELWSAGMNPVWFVQGTPPTVSVGFSAATSSAGENVTTHNIPVTLTGGTTNQTVTVDYTVTGGNAIGNGVDYTLAGNRLTFTAGQTTKNITLTVVNDGRYKGNRTVTIALTNPANAWMGAKPTHTHTILEDDKRSGADAAWALYD